MKLGFETPDGKRVDVETAFKNPKHPFRVAIVCAMWLTGFDVECLSTLYIDKPMRAHTLMQAIARANRTLSRQGLRSDRGLQRHAKKPDLSMINMEKLRDEFAKKVKNKATVIEDIRQIVEDTFAKLLDVVNGLDAEQRRSVEEGLSEDQLALFDFLQREDLTKVDRERIKQASRELLAGVLGVIAPLDRWTEKEQTQAEVQTFILARIYQELPEPTYTAEDKQHAAELVYRHIWQQRVSERFSTRQA
jgi:type I restriction enzyme R subunit